MKQSNILLIIYLLFTVTLFAQKGLWEKEITGDSSPALNLISGKLAPVTTEWDSAFYEINIHATDDSSHFYLQIGIDPTATDSIDDHLGEWEIPPGPPSWIFECKFALPDDYLFSYRDFRQGDINFNGEIVHQIVWQIGYGGTMFTATFSAPEVSGTVEIVVKDPFGGVIVNETIFDGETKDVVVTNTALTTLIITVNYTAPIPVELTTFNVEVAGENIELTWETATETNNKGFEVERSSDDVNFSSIGFVDGNGTSTEANSYSFVDFHATSGTYYYRLKQVDFDGTSAYSEVVEVDFVPSEFSLGQNYPNPFNPATKIKFALPVAAKVSVKVYNVVGQQVAELIKGQLETGLHEVEFDASKFSSGVYFYTIDATGVDGQSYSSTKKMMLMK